MGIFLIVTTTGVLLASNEKRPGILDKHSTMHRKAPKVKNYSAQNVRLAE
jgi:hypothetical protein